jgi:hypothetical protein
MKLPGTIFIRHNPNDFSERKVFLQEHILNRVPIKNVIWFEDYNTDDIFVKWVHAFLKLSHGICETSKLCKTLFIFKMMVDKNIEDALIIDDDVVFHADWEHYFKSIPDEYKSNGIINLTTSCSMNIKPTEEEVYTLSNGDKFPAFWCSVDFAMGFLNDCNPDQMIDVIFNGFIKSSGKQYLNVPLVHLYSILEKHTENDVKDNLNSYIYNYEGIRKIDLSEILTEYEIYLKRKNEVENKFEEIYGKKINIENVDYILNKDDRYKLNILNFQLNTNSISDLP